jgi:hypothetical protein
MGITVVCQSCGNRRTVPAHLYDDKIRGRVVKIACRSCGSMISVDGTLPPPPLSEMPLTPSTEDPMHLVIPAMARLPSEQTAAGNDTKRHRQTEHAAKGEPVDLTPNGDAAAPREKQISHVDGPISERGPSHTVGRYALFEQFAAG